MIKMPGTYIRIINDYTDIPENYLEFEKEFRLKALSSGKGVISIEKLLGIENTLNNYLMHLFRLGVLTKRAEVVVRNPSTHPMDYAEAVGTAKSITCNKNSVEVNYHKRSVSYMDYDFEIEMYYPQTILFHTLESLDTLEISIYIYSDEKELSLKDLWYAGKSKPNE